MTQPIVIACGGGTNSAAVIVEFVRRGQHFDLITFSDTKGEKPETYQFLDALDCWLSDRKLPLITRVKTVSPNPDRGYEGLEGMCLRLGTLPSKAFGYKACSQRFKIEPQQKFLNHWPPAQARWKAGGKITQVIGYDAGEPQRAKSYTNERYDYWYPLIEWNWGRDECIEAIKNAGLPLPGKSACFFCPSMRKPEVLALAEEHPELFARAVEMERTAKASGKLGVVKGLGRHWTWEELVSAGKQQQNLFSEVTCETDCACFDGEE